MRRGDKVANGTELFAGVFALDELPRVETPWSAPFFVVVNVQPADLPGLHWISIYCDEHRICEIFDPLGLVWSGSSRRLRVWLYKEQNCGGNVISNKLLVQHPTSSVCGHFAIFYCLRRIRYTNLFDFTSRNFSTNLSLNGSVVKAFYKQLLV